jgi:hypothetical protein
MNVASNLEDIYELSPIQEGMLFHSLYAPESSEYIVQSSFTFNGDVNVKALKLAWQEVLDRHQILRTSFQWEEVSKPVQVVYRHLIVPFEELDWRGRSSTEKKQGLDNYLKSERTKGFDFSKAPLFRLSLIRLDEKDYQFTWTYHHILLDGWATSLILKELFIFYEAFCSGENIHPEQPRPYGDYIGWLQEQDLSSAEAFWRRTLKGFTRPTPLGVKGVPRKSSGQEEEFGTKRILLPESLTSALHSLARQFHLTLNTIMQGAWALLLCRYSGEDDVVFGATVSGRPPSLRGVESMVGVFINTLPVRVKVSSEYVLLTWLTKLQEQQIEIHQYEHSPLVHVHGWSEVPRGTPLFESILVFENYPIDSSVRMKAASTEIRNVLAFERTNYPLTLVIVPGSELSIGMGYNRTRFSTDIINQMLEHFQALLERMVADPEQHLSDLLSLMKEAPFTLRTEKPREEKLDDILERSNLTKNQLLFWAEHKLQPNVPMHNLVYTFTIQGEINLEHFQKSFQTLVNSSDALRTIIVETGGVPQQRVIETFPYTVEYLGFSQFPDPEKELKTWVRNQSQILFNFEKCLFSSVLIKISDKNLFGILVNTIVYLMGSPKH